MHVCVLFLCVICYLAWRRRGDGKGQGMGHGLWSFVIITAEKMLIFHRGILNKI